MEEHSLVIDGGVLVGNYVELSFGLIANSIVAGEHVKINGNVISEKDVRIDMWSEITGDIRTKTDAYLGEFVKIKGKLIAAGNLDVGNNVKISSGYDIKGWLVVRNPLPIIMMIFFYLIALLHMGKEEEVEKVLEELFSEDITESRLLILPDRTKIDLQMIKTSSDTIIGNNCRIINNIRAKSLKMGNNVNLFGSIRTKGQITIGANCTIHGNLVSKKEVRIGRNCKIYGTINADSLILHETSTVENTSITNGSIVEKDDVESFNDLEKNLFYGFTMLDYA